MQTTEGFSVLRLELITQKEHSTVSDDADVILSVRLNNSFGPSYTVRATTTETPSKPNVYSTILWENR